MSSCPSGERLRQFLVDELDAADAAAISGHVDHCPACQEELDRLTGVTSIPPGHDPAAAPSSLALMQRMKLATPGPASPGPGPEPPSAESGWPELPDFRILAEIGRGGMGIVYRARQISLNRLVALKMVLAGSGASPSVLARFRNEAEAAARLQHPNIVQIFAIGAYRGQPFLALELVEGETLAERLNGVPQRPASAAALLETLARAMHAAHEHGILHRDLKPSNILLKASPAPPPASREVQASGGQTPRGRTSLLGGPASFLGGKPPSEASPPDVAEFGQPKIVDFGLAKLLDVETNLTRTGDLMGTPCYMAPEQALPSSQKTGDDVSAGADVYSLGAILYEMLTGRPPFRAENSLETLLLVLHQDPVSPSRLQPRLPRDLTTICLRCLEKRPGRRYESALALAEDLRRFREGQPILARRTGPVEIAWRWCRRRPSLAATAAALVASVILGLIATSAFWLRAESHRRFAEQNADRAETNLYLSLIAQARLEWRLNDPAGAAALLDRCLPAPGQPDRRGWEWRYLRKIVSGDLATLPLDDDLSMYVMGVRFSNDGRRLVAAGGNYFERTSRYGGLKVWDFDASRGDDDGLPVRHVHTEGSDFLTTLCVGGDDRLIAFGGSRGTLKVWDREAEAEPRSLPGHADSIVSLSLSPDGRRLAASDSRGRTTVLDTQAGKVLLRLDGHRARFIADGRRLLMAVRGPDETTELATWDSADGHRLTSIAVDATTFAVDPDERHAVVWAGADARVVDLESGHVRATLTGQAGEIMDATFSPNGLYVATAGTDQTVRLWDTRTGLEQMIFRGHVGRVKCVAFHPSGRYLASGGEVGGQVKIWDLTQHPEYRTVGGIPSVPRGASRRLTGPETSAMAFAADGRRILAARMDRVLIARDARGGPDTGPPLTLPMNNDWLVPAVVADFSADGGRIAVVDRDDPTRVIVSDAENGREIVALEGHAESVYHIGWSRDGRRVVTAGFDWRKTSLRREVRVWDATTGALLAEFRPGGISPSARPSLYGVAALSPDGTLVAFDDYEGGAAGDLAAGTLPARVRVCEVAGGRTRRALAGHGQPIRDLVFSGDGRVLASGDREGGIILHDLGSGRPLHARPLQGPNAAMGMLAFSPDDRLIAAVDREQVQVWHALTGHQVLVLRGAPPRRGDNGFNPRVAWSPDGQLLAALNHDGSISVWDGTDDEPLTDRFQASERRAFAWHLVHAQHAIQDSRLNSAARFHIQALTKHAPLNDDLRIEYGRVLAQMGSWQAAIDEYEQVRSRWQSGLGRYEFENAVLRLRVGDVPGWRRACEQLVDRLGGTPDRPSAELLVRASQLAPDGGHTPSRMADWVRRSAGKEPNARLATSLRGSAHYREGRYREALEVLETAIQAAGPPHEVARDWAFLAMAHARSGGREESRRWLGRLDQWLGSLEAKGANRPLSRIPQGFDTFDWIELNILHQEAREVVRTAEAARP